MGTQKRVVARKVLEFAAVLGNRHLITVTAGPSLEPILLSLEQMPDYRITTADASFPKRQAAKPNSFRVHYQAGEQWVHLDLPATAENYHAVQPLPRHRWLLVRGRASGEDDRNAHAYEADGTPAHAFHAGDGIAEVQATERGSVWVSYFDEGVFGDTVLGQSGLACLDPLGRPTFLFSDVPDPIRLSMADCYALNVCSEREVWLYFYTDFPLVRLRDKKVAGHWQMPVSGSHGFAVDGRRVLLAASYERRESLFLGRLGELDFAEVTPADEAGEPLREFRGFGRRHHLYLATRDALHIVDLRTL
jgi:hypothetical protein